MSHEIPWPADPASLPRTDDGEIRVGCFTVGTDHDGDWHYFDADGNSLGMYGSAYDAVNEGALRDDYQGTNA